MIRLDHVLECSRGRRFAVVLLNVRTRWHGGFDGREAAARGYELAQQRRSILQPVGAVAGSTVETFGAANESRMSRRGVGDPKLDAVRLRVSEGESLPVGRETHARRCLRREEQLLSSRFRPRWISTLWR